MSIIIWPAPRERCGWPVWATELSQPVPPSVHPCDRLLRLLLCLLLQAQIFYAFLTECSRSWICGRWYQSAHNPTGKRKQHSGFTSELPDSLPWKSTACFFLEIIAFSVKGRYWPGFLGGGGAWWPRPVSVDRASLSEACFPTTLTPHGSNSTQHKQGIS